MLTAMQLAWLQELLTDADKRARLTDWEERFVFDMQNRLRQFGANINVSPKHLEALKRIEAKVHEIG